MPLPDATPTGVAIIRDFEKKIDFRFTFMSNGRDVILDKTEKVIRVVPLATKNFGKTMKTFRALLALDELYEGTEIVVLLAEIFHLGYDAGKEGKND